MNAIHEFMPQALASLLRNAPLCPEKVTFAWRAAVGPSMGNVTCVELQNHVVYVRTKNAAWRREIEHSAGLIRDRLEMLLGEGIVLELRVTIE